MTTVTRSSLEFSDERILIGTILAKPGLMAEASGRVSPADFADAGLGELWGAMLTLSEAGELGDVLHTLRRLKSMQWRDSSVIDGAWLIATVRDGASTNPHYYFHAIAENGRRRRVQACLAAALAALDDACAKVDDVAERVRLDLDASRDRATTGVVTLADAARQVQRDLGEPEPEGRALWIGLHDIDERLGPIAKAGEVCVLAARPGVGKTALALQLARHHSRRGDRVLFVSLEMSAAELAGRALAAESGVNGVRLRHRARLRQCDRDDIGRAVDRVTDRIGIYAPPVAKVSDIRAAAMLARATGGLSLLVVDYLQLIAPDDKRKSRYESTTDTSNAMKRLARELGVPLLLLAQLNRQAESGQSEAVGLHCLRDSGAIEQDADAVVFLSRAKSDDGRPGAETALSVAKNRHGATGAFRLAFQPTTTTFESVAAPPVERVASLDQWNEQSDIGEPEPSF